MRRFSFAVAVVIAISACTVDKPAVVADTTTATPVAATDTTAGTSKDLESTNPKADTTKPVVPPTPVPPVAEPTSTMTVTARGLGPVRAGMTVAEANAALGNSLVVPAKLQECDYVRPKSTPAHVAFMVQSRKIARVDIQPGSDVATAAGARIGDTEAQVQSLYPGIAVTPAKYANGHYMTVTPTTGGNYRIVFETDGKKVLKYRAGSLPAVEYVEGCG